MSVKENQQQVINQVLAQNPELKLDSMNQLGEQEDYRFGFECSTCPEGRNSVYIDLAENKDNEWLAVASNKIQEHKKRFHKAVDNSA